MCVDGRWWQQIELTETTPLLLVVIRHVCDPHLGVQLNFDLESDSQTHKETDLARDHIDPFIFTNDR